MNKKVGKLIRLIGDDNLYQYLSLISLVLVWGSTLIVYNIDANFNCQLQYEDFGEEHYNWIKALKIECDNSNGKLLTLSKLSLFLYPVSLSIIFNIL